MTTAREHQRALAVLAMLHEEGPLTAHELQVATRMTRRQTTKSLRLLTEAVLVNGCWGPLPAPHVGVERQWLYRIASADARRLYDLRVAS